MFKKFTKITLLLLTLTFFPTLKVFAKTATVNNQNELKEALQDLSITTITLGSDINTTEKINITRPVTINGNNHTMKYVGTFGSNESDDNTVWGGIYLLQVYKTTVEIQNIKLTGGNAGLLVNGSKVTLTGEIDVSGNGFGGIELGQGSNVTSTSHLILKENAKIVNTTETSLRPTVWVPSDSDDAILEKNGIKQTINSGRKLTITNINDLFLPQDNPSTGDPVIASLLLGTLGIFFLAITVKKKKYFA